MTSPRSAVVEFEGFGVRFGDRWVVRDLDLALRAGEFLAIMGANGTGKSTLLRAVLGQQPASAGAVRVFGDAPGRGDRRIGAIPQQRVFPLDTPMLARELVTLGRVGRRWGLPFTPPKDRRAIDEAIDIVGAASLARRPIGSLSGGEQQRFRVAQAIVDHPQLLLCDEPLSSLDVTQQPVVAAAIDAQRVSHDAAVMFVTHDINPIRERVDRVLYLCEGNWLLGTVDEVLTSASLSELTGERVVVERRGDRIAIFGDDDHHPHHTPVTYDGEPAHIPPQHVHDPASGRDARTEGP